MATDTREGRRTPRVTRVAFSRGVDGGALVAMTLPASRLGVGGRRGLGAPQRLGFAVGHDHDELPVPDADPELILWVGATSVSLTRSDDGHPRAWLTADPCAVDPAWLELAQRHGAVLVLAPDTLPLPDSDVDAVGHLLDTATRGGAAIASVRVV